MLSMLPVVAVSTAVACGPFFPHTLLGSGPGAMLSGPYGDFGHELRRVELRVPPGVVGNATLRSAAELDDARRELGPDHPALPALEAFRHDLDFHRRGRGPVPDVPAGLPDAWSFYLTGVRALALGNEDDAVAHFQRVWAMPAAESGSRGIWAGHTLAWMHRSPGDFAAVRQRVADGLPDTLGVTGSGVGWEARWAWDAGKPVEAIHGYLVQHRAGDPGAVASLRWVFPQVLDDAELRAAVAADPSAATALTAWMVAGGGSEQQRADWLEDLPDNSVPADLRAWVAWLNRDMARLAASLDSAPDTPMVRWLKARQAMLAGDLDAAESLLARAAFAEDEVWQCAWTSRGDWEGMTELSPARETASERGALLLRQGDDVGALRAFAQAGHWFDTAHVAERVVDTAVLRAQVDTDLLPLLPERQQAEMRVLLGRRLFREGDYAAAATYFEPEQAARVRHYQALLEAGTAPALWEAARLMRFEGIDLAGTELDPDFAWASGSLPAWTLRGRADTDPILGLTDREASRIEATAPAPDARFHYRYVAADLAWQAAERIPEGHPEAPRVLCQAGRWLMHRDPSAADRYYKEMVWRAWGTPLGNTADALRWFPDSASCELEDVTVDSPPPRFGWLSAWWDSLWE